MDKIKVYDPAEDNFEYGAVWIKNPVHRKGDEPKRFKATNVKETEVITKHLNNLAMEELNLFPNQKIKPMFDRDSYDTPIDTEYDIKLIKNLLGDNCIVKTAARPTRIKNGKTFYSKRYYVQNKRIRAFQLLDFINMRNEIPKNHFDLSKYGKGGQFYTLYNDKKLRGKDKDGKYQPPEDVPSLVPENDPDPNPLDYYATYVLEDYDDYDIKWEALQTIIALRKEEETKVVYKEDDDEVVLEKTTEIDDIIEHLKPERAEGYSDWIKGVLALINYCIKIKLNRRKIEGVIHAFSALCPDAYDENKVDEWITNNYERIVNSDPEKKLGRNYLINVCLKEDDPKYWADKYRCRDYKSVLKVFNKECIRVLGAGKWIRFCQIDDQWEQPYEVLSKDDLCFRFAVDAKYFYKVIRKDKDDKEVVSEYSIVDTMSPFWKDPNVRKYDRIIFAPLRPDDNKYFNTWVGWKAMTYKVCKDYSKCEIFINHLKVAWCKNDERLCKWFLEYLSGILRGAQTCVCPIVRGKQGSGKDCFMSELFMNRIVGKDYCFTTNDPVKHLFGTFNGALLNKSFVVIEEGGYDLEKCHNQLKSVITNEFIAIEEKYQNVVNRRNYCNPIVSTNKHDIIKGDKGMKQRRLIYIECDPVKKSDEYYTAYFDALEDEEALSALYHYLLDPEKVFQYDINNRGYLQKTMPDTKIGMDIALRNMPDTTKFLKRYFPMDDLKLHICDNPQKPMKIKGKNLQKSYKNYCEFQGSEKVNLEHFTNNLLNYNDIEYKRLSDAMYYIIPFHTIEALYDLITKEESKEIVDAAVLYERLRYDFDNDE